MTTTDVPLEASLSLPLQHMLTWGVSKPSSHLRFGWGRGPREDRVLAMAGPARNQTLNTDIKTTQSLSKVPGIVATEVHHKQRKMQHTKALTTRGSKKEQSCMTLELGLIENIIQSAQS